MGMPGYGDSATWGAVWHPNDPRRDEGAEEAFIDGLEGALEELEVFARDNADSETVPVEDIQYGINEVRRLIVAGWLQKAEKKLELMVEEYL